jgi:RNA polymerase sigma-70 factor (ECF subfamily)
VEFDDLFDQFYPSLHRYCLRLTGDPDVADDVAQEAFVRMLRRDVSGEPPGLRSWLYKTALNLIRDRSRVRSNRRRLLEENPGHPGRPDEPETPDRTAERAEAVREVRAALEVLDERDRAILLMREEGFRYREIAEAVGVATSSVGKLLARAQRSFAEAFREMNGRGTGDDDDLETESGDGRDEPSARR